MPFSPEIVLGPPGTGKTSYLMTQVSNALEEGMAPNRIGFVAFTKKAANEALERAEKQFKLAPKQLPHFRTLHSFAFRMLGLKKSQVLSSRDLKEFGNILGLRLRGVVNAEEGAVFGSSPGDKALFISNLARVRNISLEKQWKENTEDLGWFEVERVHRGLAKFKESRGLIDFTDMLMKFIEIGERPKLELLVVDEAQDLSRLQWDMVRALAKNTKRVIIAGDDDQAIFQWAGADVEYFVKLPGKVKILDKSYRTPKNIQEYAQKILQRVSVRRTKVWAPREGEGKVLYHSTAEAIDMSTGSWLVLARNGYLLDNVEEQCRREGLPYDRQGRRSISEKAVNTIQAWERLRKGGRCIASETAEIVRRICGKLPAPPMYEDYTMDMLKEEYNIKTDRIWHEAFVSMNLVERSYMVATLRRGEKLTKTPRIRLSTIHSAKGGEADNVVLFGDMSPRSYGDMVNYPDNEYRVFYVGATRTRNNLHIIMPNTKFSFSQL